jgi:hypothetical protein
MARNSAYQTRLEAIIRPLPNHIWAADFPLRNLEEALFAFAKDWGGVNLTPDFQRGHVWTQEQQERLMEALLRGALPSSALLIQFNCPHWNDDHVPTDLPYEVQCVDGLQRITAIRRFLKSEIRAFGMVVDDFSGTRFDINRSFFAVKFAMHDFKTRAELLQYYLDLNDGGTPHTREEIDRVRGLLEAAVSEQTASPSP